MDWPLLGRDGELDRLEHQIRAAGRGVALFGRMGTGKTRLARALIDRLDSPGTRAHWTVASTATASIPYGALTELLPDAAVDAASRTAMLRAARRHVQAGVEQLVLGIDDAHLLDLDSLALLRQIAVLPQVTLVLTLRPDASTPDELQALWKDDHLERVDLTPLAREVIVQLAELTLEGPVHPSLAAELWHHTQGNPLFLRELLLAEGPDGRQIESDGTWRLAGALRVPSRLAELVESRFTVLSAEARVGLVAVALLETVRASLLLEFVDVDAVRELEVCRVVEFGSGPDPLVRLAHPLYGLVARTRTPHAETVAVARDLVPLVTKHARTDSANDRMQLAELWQLAGDPGRPGLFLDAARQALSRGDLDRALQLAAQCSERGGGDAARLTQAEALVYLGRSREAVALLDAIEEIDDEHVARIALLRCHDLLFNHGDATRAGATIGRARAIVTTGPWRDRLDAAAAMAALWQGDAQHSIALPTLVSDQEPVDDRAVLTNLIIGSLARILAGDLTAAEPVVARATPLAQRLRSELPLACDQVRVNRVLMAWHGAQLGDAAAFCRDALADAMAETAIDRIGIWSTMLGAVLVETGHLRMALVHLDDATTHLEKADALGLRTTAVALGARCHAGLGDSRLAARRLAGLTDVLAVDIRARIHHGRSHAWVLAIEGDAEAAVAAALETGAEGVDAAHVVWGAASLHDAVRFGAGPRALELLAPLAARHDAELLALYAQHAHAIATEDPEALGEVAYRFSQAGLTLYAAEAHAQAAEHFRRLHRSREARRADARAADLLQRLPPVRTPALMRTEDPLTRREREIAMIARTGRSSREIAAQLSLSVRTIDNHLAAVYRKTGIDGRHQLDDILAPARSADPI